MKKSLIFLIFCYSTAYSQVQLEISYQGDQDATSVELYEYTDFIIHSKKIVIKNTLLSRGSSKKIQLEFSQPSRLLLINNSILSKFFVQPGNTYQLTIKDDTILIESSDNINRSIDIIDAKIKDYFKENYQIELDDDKKKRKRTLSLLNGFVEEIKEKFSGTAYQNQLIKYKLAETKSTTYYFLGDKNFFAQIESDLIINQNIQLQNPAYMHFLFDYYYRRFTVHNFRTRKYSYDLTEFEVLKLETAAITDKMIQQLVMINFIKEAYNRWAEDNLELMQILDSLAEYGLHEQIRQASAGLAESLGGIKIDLELPDFSMTKLNGDEISLSDFHGKYVLLDFWFIGCKPCQRAVPYKKKLFDEFGDCMEILSINPINSADDIVKYKSKENLPWTFINMDKNTSIMETLNILHYPTYYLLDPEGKILMIPIFEGSIEKEFISIEAKLKESCQ